MLTHLYIRNFALIDELDISFTPGFAVITGETGAGKSIILGALSLLSGSRADTRAIKEGASKCIVEATFTADDSLRALLTSHDIDADDTELLLRREVSSTAKSRAFINDTPVSIALLKSVSEQLIDIHSQHQNLLLKDNSFQLSVVDTIAHNQQLLADYVTAHKTYLTAKSQLDKALRDKVSAQQNIDFIRFQYDELMKLALRDGEEEELQLKATTMQHAEDIKTALYDADNHLCADTTGILPRLHHALTAIRSITKVFPSADDIATRLDSAYIDLKDLSADVADMVSSIDFDSAESERINDRLDDIYTAEKKHHVQSIAELLTIQSALAAELDAHDNSDELIRELQQTLTRATEQCHNLADELTAQRTAVTTTIEQTMLTYLQQLGLPNVQFRVNITEKALSADGKDMVEFLFSANLGVPLRAISAVASGGEIARVMLSLKALLSGAVKLPTIIFDEIDTGVSGKIAENMAQMMQDMGKAHRQVISITHLPQIAARGEAHYKVFKSQVNGITATQMTLLSPDERVTEIAQMLSGNDISQAAISNAKELLQR